MSAPSSKQRLPQTTADELLARPEVTVVDLRSPQEFAHDHVPGALNVPLFEDLDRAAIGTLYAHASPEVAFEEGRRRTTERIGAIVERIARETGWRPPRVDLRARVHARTKGGIERMAEQLAPVGSAGPLGGNEVVFYCWRGGLRSRSVVALVRELGLDRAVLLAGGYKAYRAAVRARLATWKAPTTLVLRGYTGVGKTLVLRALEGLRAGSTVDLEALAAHRSSILGAVGLAPVSQKRFDSRLLQRLQNVRPGPLAFEGESRKVGDIVLPDTVWRALCSGIAVELTAPLERRVQVLVDDYLSSEGSREELATRLPFIEERLGRQRWRGVLVDLLREGREHELVEILLERYYDPLYRHSEGRQVRTYARTVDASSPVTAAEELAELLEQLSLTDCAAGAPRPLASGRGARPGSARSRASSTGSPAAGRSVG